MAEINARKLLDANGEVYFPFTHVTCVEGIPDDITDFDVGAVKEDVSNVQTDVSTLQSQISSLQSAVANMPTVTDTGWVNIPLSSTAQPYNTAQTPKARMITIKNNIKFLSLRGAIKDVSAGEIIGSLPSPMLSSVTESTEFVQSMHATNGFSNFNRWTLLTTGEIKLQYSTTTITSTQWVPVDTTIML
ncbi:hypothetical protein [Staphylococcus arlettae]|uniref:hypothetical protein n=1 Tax=Staphylococcus arlettae TaxID=29378 RepID=UPI003F55BBC2